jgi:hypothetical protein
MCRDGQGTVPAVVAVREVRFDLNLNDIGQPAEEEIAQLAVGRMCGGHGGLRGSYSPNTRSRGILSAI